LVASSDMPVAPVPSDMPVTPVPLEALLGPAGPLGRPTGGEPDGLLDHPIPHCLILV